MRIRGLGASCASLFVGLVAAFSTVTPSPGLDASFEVRQERGLRRDIIITVVNRTSEVHALEVRPSCDCLSIKGESKVPPLNPGESVTWSASVQLPIPSTVHPGIYLNDAQGQHPMFVPLPELCYK